MTIYLGADHRGFAAKQQLVPWLQQQGLDVIDLGAAAYNQADDFPDYAFAVADAVAKNPTNRGVVLCGGGTGVLVAANKVVGIRAGLAASPDIVLAARRDDDINVLAVAADTTPFDQVQELVKLFLQTDYEQNERRDRRLEKIADRDQ